MQKLKRRSFIKSLIAAPMAGKAMAQETLQQTGYSAFGATPPDVISGSVEVAAESITPSWSKAKKMLSRLMNGDKLPEFMEADIQEQAQQFNGIDADLAAMNSVSVSYKIRKQQKINIERLRQLKMRRFYSREERDRVQADFQEKTGIWLDLY